MLTRTLIYISLLATISIAQVTNPSPNTNNAVPNPQASTQTLPVIQQTFDAHIKEILALIPNINNFAGGDTGYYIPGGDQFDISKDTDNYFRQFTGGNIIYKSLQNYREHEFLGYTNGLIQNTNFFGVGSSYYTKKYDGGIFTLAADLKGAEYFIALDYFTIFRITGRLETYQYNGYTGVFYSVYVNDATSTTNQLLIYPNDSTAFNAYYYAGSGFLVQYGMNNVKRAYLLMYSTKRGRVVTSAEQSAIFTKTIDIINSLNPLVVVQQVLASVNMEKSKAFIDQVKQAVDQFLPITNPTQSFLEKDLSLSGQGAI